MIFFIKNNIRILALLLKYESYIKTLKLVQRVGLIASLRILKFKFVSGNIEVSDDYNRWLKAYDNFDEHDQKLAKKQIRKFKSQPLISIVMPTYNSNIAWLKTAIESVQNQIYSNWELCIADDASTDKNLIKILNGYSKKDPRVKVIFRKKNGHISEASNSALSIAVGEWVALLDHDDILPSHALFYVAKTISEYPNVDMIYSDEDKISIQDRRFEPYFKCNWNRDLFYSQNVFSHLGVYRKKLINLAGGFRKGFEGSQDYDLALRCLELSSDDRVKHIPRVLYHWRSHPKSTASTSEAKPYAMMAGENALNSHFKRIGVKAKAELIGYGYRIRYSLPKNPPLVSIIIPTRNRFNHLSKCIKSILDKTTYPKYNIKIIDNGSDDLKTLGYLRSLKNNPLISISKDSRPFNYSQLNNAAVDSVNGDLIALLNDDIEVISPEWLSEMVSNAIRPGVGAVGAKLFYPNNTIQHAGIILGLGKNKVAGHSHHGSPKDHFGYFGRAALQQSYSAITAACLVIKKSIYMEVGGLNATHLKVAFNDVDFCLKLLKKGYKNIWTPYAELYHHESLSRGREDSKEKKDRFNREVKYFKKKWKHYIYKDNAYSPNLTLDYSDFSYAWPPRVKKFSKHN